MRAVQWLRIVLLRASLRASFFGSNQRGSTKQERALHPGYNLLALLRCYLEHALRRIIDGVIRAHPQSPQAAPNELKVFSRRSF